MHINLEMFTNPGFLSFDFASLLITGLRRKYKIVCKCLLMKSFLDTSYIHNAYIHARTDSINSQIKFLSLFTEPLSTV